MKHPYCEQCNIIWSKSSIGQVLKCTRCGNPLVLKSFEPWKRCVLGIIIILVAFTTLAIDAIPIIWSGGFISGAIIFAYGVRQWSELRAIDKN